MKLWFTIFSLCFLLSCSSSYDDGFYDKPKKDKGEIDAYDLPKHAINDMVKGLAVQMIDSAAFVNAKTPIAVASFVNLKNLDTTNWLGMQISENFIFELQHHGYIVVDFKAMAGGLRVTPEGDFILSRDWSELPERQVIDYVLTGTMLEQEDGVMLNVRMIGMRSHVVVATAQSFIPNWVIGDQLTKNENVKMKDGMIIREPVSLLENERAIEIRN